MDKNTNRLLDNGWANVMDDLNWRPPVLNWGPNLDVQFQEDIEETYRENYDQDRNAKLWKTVVLNFKQIVVKLEITQRFLIKWTYLLYQVTMNTFYQERTEVIARKTITKIFT